MRKKWIFRFFACTCICLLLVWFNILYSINKTSLAEIGEDYSIRKLTKQLYTLSSYLPLEDAANQFKKSLQNISCNLNLNTYKIDPDSRLNVSGLIIKQGFSVEEYHVTTEDGFILGVQRIPHGRHTKKSNGRVVFLQHGLGGSSTHWVENLANESLAFLLSDAGFDVWLGNVRGTVYSMKHRRLRPKDQEFWKWSWDAMALLDLPAMINFVLTKTKQKSLFYVGHSQGTLIAFAALAQNKHLNKKVKMLFALAPVATVADITSPIRYFADYSLVKPLMDAFSMLKIYSLLPDHTVSQALLKSVCENDKSRMFCENIFFIVAGYGCKRMNHSRFQVYVSNSPDRTSIQNLNHFSQMVKSGEFSMYDYGTIGNYYRYGQGTPPNYVIENIKTPVAMYWGGNDMLADPTDVKKLRSRLKHIAYDRYIKNYSHLDFIWSMDVADVVYRDIISIMQKYGA